MSSVTHVQTFAHAYAREPGQHHAGCSWLACAEAAAVVLAFLLPPPLLLLLRGTDAGEGDMYRLPEHMRDAVEAQYKRDVARVHGEGAVRFDDEYKSFMQVGCIVLWVLAWGLGLQGRWCLVLLLAPRLAG